MFSAFGADEIVSVKRALRRSGSAGRDGTMLLAIETSIDDQYASLSAKIVSGRNMRPIRFDSVDDLLEVLD